jgi:hypothetical protein
MSFFKDMNLARGVILGSVAGSLVLAWMCWQKSDEVAVLRTMADKQEIEKTVRTLMQTGHKHTQLKKAGQSEGLGAQDDLESYVRRQAAFRNVEIGDVNLVPGNEQRTKGIVDKVYRIKSSDKDRSFDRMRLTNFFYKLEADSGRVKLTEIKMEAADKRLKDHETPNDQWTFEAEITSRQRAQ